MSRKTMRLEEHFSIILQRKDPRRCCSINRHRRSCLSIFPTRVMKWKMVHRSAKSCWALFRGASRSALTLCFDGLRHRVNWKSLDRHAKKIRKERWMKQLSKRMVSGGVLHIKQKLSYEMKSSEQLRLMMAWD